MSKKIYGGLALQNNSEVGFYDADNTNFVSLAAPAVVGTSLSFILPATDGAANQVLSTDASENLSFITVLLNVVEDTTPQLGGALDTNKNAIQFVETGIGSEYVALQAPAAIAANLTFLLPAADAVTAGDSMISDAAGNLSFATRATPALDNLASVAINTSLISDTNNIYDLGSATIGWANVYGNALHMDSNSQTTALQGSASATASVTYSLPPADGTAGYVLSTNGSGVMSWVSNAAPAPFVSNWVTADTATKAFTHSLGTTDIMVQVYDVATGETIDIDSVTRTSTSVVTLVASEAPPAGNWRVLVTPIT